MHLVGEFQGTMCTKESITITMFIHDPHLQSYRRLLELVPSRHRERRPYGNLVRAVPSTLELRW